MQALAWILRLLAILVLAWFAVKNSQVVTVHGLPDQSWQAPLVFVLLVAFVAGVVIGLLAWLPTVIRQRRAMSRLRRAAPPAASPPAAPEAPPALPVPPVDGHGV